MRISEMQRRGPGTDIPPDDDGRVPEPVPPVQLARAAQDGLEHIAQVKRAIVNHRWSDAAAGAETIGWGVIDIGQQPEVLDLAGPQVFESGRPLIQSSGAIRAGIELRASGYRDAALWSLARSSAALEAQLNDAARGLVYLLDALGERAKRAAA